MLILFKPEPEIIGEAFFGGARAFFVFCPTGGARARAFQFQFFGAEPDTLGLNEQEVYKNVSGVLLIVHKGFFKSPLNAPTQKIIGWEVFVQSQSEHLKMFKSRCPKEGQTCMK